MTPRQRAEAVKAATDQEWSARPGVLELRNGRKLVVDRKPEFIYDPEGQIVGVDVWVWSPETDIDPHRRIVNPPTVPRANVWHEERNGERVRIVGEPDPAAAFWEAVWDSVEAHPNPGGQGTVTTVFGDEADQFIFSGDSTYSNARAGTGSSLGLGATPSTTDVGQNQTSGGTYFVREGFVSFDTSAIGDGENIQAIVLDLWLTDDLSVDADFICEARESDWGSSVTTADWVPGANLSGLTLMASINTSGIGSEGAYKTFSSEAAFLTADNLKTGFVHLLLCSSRHRIGNAPGNDEREFVQWAAANVSGTTQDPKLTITHETPNTAPTANAGADQSVDEGTTVNLDGTGSTDPEDGQAGLGYEWTVLDADGTGLVDGDITNRLTDSASFTAPEVSGAAANIVIQLEVTDSGGLTDTDTTTITVSDTTLIEHTGAGGAVFGGTGNDEFQRFMLLETTGTGGLVAGGAATPTFENLNSVTADIVLEWDFDNDGDFDEPEEDVTEFLVAGETFIGRDWPSLLTGKAGPGKAKFTLRNDDDRFNFFNSSSPLNQGSFSLRTGRRLRVRTRNQQQVITGGDSTFDDSTHRYHVFTSSGDLTVAAEADVEFLLVGGGGGAGGSNNSVRGSGGGGAGGIHDSTATLATGTYPVVIGAGGSGATGDNPGTNGGDSTFNSLTATGGGGGSGADNGAGHNGSPGGSGGGAGAETGTGGSGTVGQGNDGGDTTGGGLARGGAGGGGATGVGANGESNLGGDGGTGLEWPTGSGDFYAGGGGGGQSGGGSGGSSVGGQGDGSNAVASTGSGGGGISGVGSTGGDGSDGVLILRYPLSAATFDAAAGSDPTLLARDRFRVNGALGDAETGQTWNEPLTDGFTVSDEQVVADTEDAEHIAVVDVDAADYYAQLRIVRVGPETTDSVASGSTVSVDGGVAGLVYRYHDANDYSLAVLHADDAQLKLINVVAGTPTVVTTEPVEVYTEMTLGVLLSGDSVTLYHEGVPVATQTAIQTAATSVGMYALWGAGNLAPQLSDFHVWNELPSNVEGVLWTGDVEELKTSVVPGLDKVATVNAIGRLSRAANQQVFPPSSVEGQPTGVLVGNTLAMTNMLHPPGPIDEGDLTTGPVSLDRLNAIEALRRFEEAELGFIYETQEGHIGFDSRTARDSASSQAAFTDTHGGQFSYRSVLPMDWRREIVNRVRAGVAAGVPSVVSVDTHDSSTIGSNLGIPMPATVDAGDLLLVVANVSAGGEPGPPAGWRQLSTTTEIDADEAVNVLVFARAAVGDEGGATYNFSNGDPLRAVAAVYRIADWFGSIKDGVGLEVSASDELPPIDAQWEPQPSLLVATHYARHFDIDPDRDYPIGYTNGQFVFDGPSVIKTGLQTAERLRSGESQENLSFNMPDADRSFVTVTAVRGFNGDPPVNQGVAQVQADDLSSQDEHNAIRTHRNSSDLFASEADATTYANLVLTTYADDRPILAIEFRATKNAAYRAQAIRRRVSDRITLIASGDTGLGVSQDFFIESINHKWSDGGFVWDTTWELSPVSE